MLCVCPACHGDLSWSVEQIECRACGRDYVRVDGIPVLVGDRAGGDDFKRSQASFFDQQPAEWESRRPHGAPSLYGWLMCEKFRRSIVGLEPVLRGGTVLTVCGGSGMDAEFLARHGGRVIASDISLEGARRTQRRAREFGVDVAPLVADAEALPFRDRTVDLAYVHDGLHHLQDPMVGLREMIRVAGTAVSLTEPARAVATALAVRLGISKNEEEAGNRVERLDTNAVTALLEDYGLAVLGSERYAMYYQHEPGAAVRLLSRPGLRPGAERAFHGLNAVLGSIGNKLSIRAVRPVGSPPSDARTAENGDCPPIA